MSHREQERAREHKEDGGVPGKDDVFLEVCQEIWKDIAQGVVQKNEHDGYRANQIRVGNEILVGRSDHLSV